MGMYSYVSYENIEVKDMKGLKNVIIEFNKIYDEDIFKLKYLIKKDDEGKEYFSFEKWDGIKLISYWYDEEVLFLNVIAPYIEGHVDFEFETRDEASSIYFENGKCRIEMGKMDWSVIDDYEKFLNKDIPRDIKKLLILGDLKNGT